MSAELLAALGRVNSSRPRAERQAAAFHTACLGSAAREQQRGRPLAALLHSGRAPHSDLRLPALATRWPLIEPEFTPPPQSVPFRMGLLKARLGADSLLYPFVLASDENSTAQQLWLSSDMLPLGMATRNFVDDSATSGFQIPTLVFVADFDCGVFNLCHFKHTVLPITIEPLLQCV